MDQERQARENEEKERVERMKKIKEQFADPRSQWEKDKTDIQNIAMQEKGKEQSSGVEAGGELGHAI
jgi:mannan polymerase II complex ANP1 subunit